MNRPILYFDGQSLFREQDRDNLLVMMTSWGAGMVGQPIEVCGYEVGQVIDYTVSESAGRVGLVVEWSNQLDEVGNYQGGLHGH